MNLTGEHASNHNVESPIQQERPDSPVPSCASMKSDQSMDPPIVSRERTSSTKLKAHQKRPVSPAHSCVSMKSDQSINHPIMFKGGDSSTKLQDHQERSESPVPSYVSMKRHQSIDPPTSDSGLWIIQSSELETLLLEKGSTRRDQTWMFFMGEERRPVKSSMHYSHREPKLNLSLWWQLTHLRALNPAAVALVQTACWSTL